MFGDAGMMEFRNSKNEKEWSKLRMDAGAGVSFTLKKFWVLQQIKPFTIRFDVPFYLSDIPNSEQKNVAFRWLIGIQRAF